MGTHGSLPAKSELTQELAEVRPSHPPAGRPPCPQRPHSQHPGNQNQLCLARTWADMEGAGISGFKLTQRDLWGGDSWPGCTDHTNPRTRLTPRATGSGGQVGRTVRSSTSYGHSEDRDQPHSYCASTTTWTRWHHWQLHAALLAALGATTQVLHKTRPVFVRVYHVHVCA